MQISTQTGYSFARMPEPKDKRLDDYYRTRLIRDQRSVHANIDAMSPQYGVHAGSTILDLACGCGWNTYNLAHRYPDARIIGLDLDPQCISVARDMHPGINNLEFRVADANHLSREFNGDVDWIVMTDALHHFDNGEVGSLAKQIYFALRGGGQFSFDDLNREAAYDVMGDNIYWYTL